MGVFLATLALTGRANGIRSPLRRRFANALWPEIDRGHPVRTHRETRGARYPNNASRHIVYALDGEGTNDSTSAHDGVHSRPPFDLGIVDSPRLPSAASGPPRAEASLTQHGRASYFNLLPRRMSRYAESLVWSCTPLVCELRC